MGVSGDDCELKLMVACAIWFELNFCKNSDCVNTSPCGVMCVFNIIKATSPPRMAIHRIHVDIGTLKPPGGFFCPRSPPFLLFESSSNIFAGKTNTPSRLPQCANLAYI